jgi:hypothetical protein
VYAWIWRRLPFGLPGKLAGSVLLVATVGLLLWYVVFPFATPLLPFDDVQVGTGTEQVDAPAGQNADTVIPGEEDAPDELPYSEESNNPHPSAT